MIFIAYYRVSTRRQARSGLGLDAQRQAIRAFVKDPDVLVGEYIEASSGRKDNRAELGKAVALAKKSGASILIAKLDRFSRRVSFIASMMECGVRLVVVDMPNATDFQLHIFAALAQEERRMISARTKLALAQAKARGTQLGKNGRTLATSNAKNADAFAETLIEQLPKDWHQMSYSKIADYLNAKAVRTVRGSSFFPQTVKNYLTRESLSDLKKSI